MRQWATLKHVTSGEDLTCVIAIGFASGSNTRFDLHPRKAGCSGVTSVNVVLLLPATINIIRIGTTYRGG